MDNIYTTNEYIAKNPSLHEEDSPWKIEKIIPLIDKFAEQVKKTEIKVLDVGGGAGNIFKAVSAYLASTCAKKVAKHALDLSPGMLAIQGKNNPDMSKVFNESICKTTLENKGIDLVLMIDILEHVPDDLAALKELARISNYVIFKVPLENSLVSTVRNTIRREIDPQKLSKEKYGHINFYTYQKLIQIIKENLGEISFVCPANSFDYLRKSKNYNKEMKTKSKIFYLVASWLSKIMPPSIYLSIFGDFAMILVKCY